MSELRWILLGAGLALILGLWWWENRKARAAQDAGERAMSPSSPQSRPAADVDHGAEPGVGMDAPYVPTVERVRVARRPPLIEIPEDMEVDVSDFVVRDRRHPTEPTLSPEPEPEPGIEADTGHAANEGEGPPFDEIPDETHRPPWVRTQPLERDEVAPRPEEEPSEPVPADPAEQRTLEAARQRIVALRLVATGAHWSGEQLRGAMEAEDLTFGPYSVFHREREDGKSLLYVASMMEPGSFDPARMDEQEFPGVSIFGVVPGPLDAPSTFDLVLSVGRALAERLKGQLQDEQGSTLTSQRILNLREELVHFEHRNRRLRRN